MAFRKLWQVNILIHQSDLSYEKKKRKGFITDFLDQQDWHISA